MSGHSGGPGFRQGGMNSETDNHDSDNHDSDNHDSDDPDAEDRDTNGRVSDGTGGVSPPPVPDAWEVPGRGRGAAGELKAGLEAILDQVAGAGRPNLGAREAGEMLKALEWCRRRIDATAVALVGEVESRRWYRHDGFRSPSALVRHVCGVSQGEASRRVRAARCLSDLDTVNSAFAAGDLGVEQLDVIARLHANPRVRDPLVDAQGILVEDAQSASYRDFRAVAKEWERLADIEGSIDETKRQHANR